MVVLTLLLFFIFLSALLYNKLKCFWCKSKVCLIGKTAIITGGASGMGYETTLALASRGCRIIICDVTQNLMEVVEEIKKKTYNEQIIGKLIDLQSFKSVRSFANDILNSENKLDILICNAGIGEYRRSQLTEDGLQRTMQVNYFSHFLLTHLLLDLLKKSAPSRIIFVGSLSAYFTYFNIDELNPGPKYFTKWYTKINGGIYSNSKQAIAAAAKNFGEKLQGTGVTANAVHPGIVKTKFIPVAINNDKNFIFGNIYTFLFYKFGHAPEEGVQTTIHLALSNEVQNISGRSFSQGRVIRHPLPITEKFCKELWDATIGYTQLKPNEISC
ncbi:hypothetical protein ABEB36_013774 [Hypothenemus hampei]|uniref:Uncharacterized protein n=1 Tax=Hypothenemus hampei TaxID=57062 RepID=A0ABD1E7D6_HYPHA